MVKGWVGKGEFMSSRPGYRLNSKRKKERKNERNLEQSHDMAY